MVMGPKRGLSGCRPSSISRLSLRLYFWKHSTRSLRLDTRAFCSFSTGCWITCILLDRQRVTCGPAVTLHQPRTYKTLHIYMKNFAYKSYSSFKSSINGKFQIEFEHLKLRPFSTIISNRTIFVLALMVQ